MVDDSVNQTTGEIVSDRMARFQAYQAELDDLIATFRPGVDFMIGQNKKAILLKAGAERVAIYFGWHTDLEPSVRPYEGGDLPHGVYVTCRVIQPEREKDNKSRIWQDGTIAVGLGAAALAEFTDSGPLAFNTAIKMAGKRAMVDGVMRAAGLSDRFGQDVPPDLDETLSLIPEEGEPEIPEGHVYGRIEPVEHRPIPVNPAVEEKRAREYRIGEVKRLFSVKNIPNMLIASRLKTLFDVGTVEELNLNQLEEMIDRLNHPDKYNKK